MKQKTKKQKWISYQKYRSAKTGLFVTRKYAQRHPATCYLDTIKYKR